MIGSKFSTVIEKATKSEYNISENIWVLWTWLLCFYQSRWEIGWIQLLAHVLACMIISVLLKIEQYSIVCIYHIYLSMFSSGNTWVGSTSWLLWIMLLWTMMYKCFQILASNSFGIPLLVEMQAHKVMLFIFLRKCQAVFHSSFTILDSN